MEKDSLSPKDVVRRGGGSERGKSETEEENERTYSYSNSYSSESSDDEDEDEANDKEEQDDEEEEEGSEEEDGEGTSSSSSTLSLKKEEESKDKGAKGGDEAGEDDEGDGEGKRGRHSSSRHRHRRAKRRMVALFYLLPSRNSGENKNVENETGVLEGRVLSFPHGQPLSAFLRSAKEKLFLPDEEDHQKFEDTTKVYLCSGAEIEHEKFVRDGDTLLLVRGGQPHHPQTFRSFLLSSVAHASSSSSASSAASSPLVPPKHKGKQEDKEAEGEGEGGGESAVVVASGGRALHYLLSSRALVVGRRGEEGEGEEGEVEGEGEEAKRLRLLLRPLGEGEQEAKQEHKLEDILTLFIQNIRTLNESLRKLVASSSSSSSSSSSPVAFSSLEDEMRKLSLDIASYVRWIRRLHFFKKEKENRGEAEGGEKEEGEEEENNKLLLLEEAKMESHFAKVELQLKQVLSLALQLVRQRGEEAKEKRSAPPTFLGQVGRSPSGRRWINHITSPRGETKKEASKNETKKEADSTPSERCCFYQPSRNFVVQPEQARLIL